MLKWFQEQRVFFGILKPSSFHLLSISTRVEMRSYATGR
jgi:hypothetical protein